MDRQKEEVESNQNMQSSLEKSKKQNTPTEFWSVSSPIFSKEPHV